MLSADEIDESQVVMTYEVNSDDLNNYRRIQDYKPGKANPFSSYETETTTENTESGKTTGQANSGASSSPSNSNNSNSSTTTIKDNNQTTTSGGKFFQDKGTK